MCYFLLLHFGTHKIFHDNLFIDCKTQGRNINRKTTVANEIQKYRTLWLLFALIAATLIICHLNWNISTIWDWTSVLKTLSSLCNISVVFHLRCVLQCQQGYCFITIAYLKCQFYDDQPHNFLSSQFILTNAETIELKKKTLNVSLVPFVTIEEIQ